MSQGSGRPGALGFLFEQWGSGFSPRAPLLQVACRHSLRLGRGLVTGLWIIVTFRLQYEDDYKYKFSILSVSARAQNLKLVVESSSNSNMRGATAGHGGWFHPAGVGLRTNRRVVWGT